MSLSTMPRLLCLMGAECTGKTTLARALAQRWDVGWVAEYLRDFCDERGRTPYQEEQITIIHAQLAAEEAALAFARQKGHEWVICDTAPLLTAMYSDFVFGDTSLYPLARQLHSRYAHTLVLAPAIAWVADGIQRDSEAARQRIHTTIVRELAGREKISYVAEPSVDSAETALEASGIRIR